MNLMKETVSGANHNEQNSRRLSNAHDDVTFSEDEERSEPSSQFNTVLEMHYVTMDRRNGSKCLQFMQSIPHPVCRTRVFVVRD